MKNSKLVLYGFLHAFGAVAYISLVAMLMFNGEKFFGNGKSLIIPIAMLSLFVLSATIMGTLILGRPILYYLNGQKTEGIKLFVYTIGWLFAFTFTIFILMATTFKRGPYLGY